MRLVRDAIRTGHKKESVEMEYRTENAKMHVRKLLPEEHGRTRTLWEAVFTEDSASFLDYYYQYKTADNEIYVIEEADEIRAMLQLNPYQVMAEARPVSANYIIAVATDARYRKRGLMAELLRTSMRQMYGRKEPFTFLMPAAEAIYYPFDFRFVYRQPQTAWRRTDCTEEASQGHGMTVRTAERHDCKEIADLANACLRDVYQVYVVRDAHYYQVRLAELQSEGGGLLLLHADGELKACCAYAGESEIELMEPLALQGYGDWLKRAAFDTIGKEAGQIPVLACEESESEHHKPIIMVRIIHLESMLQCLRAEEGLDCRLRIVDPIIAENNKVLRVFSRAGMIQTEEPESGGYDGELSIAALTSILFGALTMEELQEKEIGFTITEPLKTQLEKIIPAQKVFLNEIV